MCWHIFFFGKHFILAGSVFLALQVTLSVSFETDCVRLSVHAERIIERKSAALIPPNPFLNLHIVCAQHEHVRTYLKGLNKFVKYKFSVGLNSCVR